MYNKVMMLGNLTRDIELKYLPSGAAVAKSAIATSYKYKSATGEQKDEVCFLDFNMFGRSAEVANQYLRKGSKVLLEGRLILEQWVAQDGTNRSKHSLRVETMKMLDSKSDSAALAQDNPNPSGQSYSANQNNNYSANQGGMQAPTQRVEQKIPEINIDEDEIPF